MSVNIKVCMMYTYVLNECLLFSKEKEKNVYLVRRDNIAAFIIQNMLNLGKTWDIAIFSIFMLDLI